VRLQQVLTNLVGNAIKFTEAGHVLLAVREERAPMAARGCTFSVTDTGIGIPPEKHESDLRGVPAGGRLDDPPLRRHGPRPHDLGQPRAADGRPHLGGQRARAGSTFHFTVTLDVADVPDDGRTAPRASLVSMCSSWTTTASTAAS
jgi:hypothetical protein